MISFFSVFFVVSLECTNWKKNNQNQILRNWQFRLVIKNTKLKSYQFQFFVQFHVCMRVRVRVFFFWLKRKKITFLLANIIKMYAWNPNCTIRKKSGCCVFFLVFCFVTAEKFIYMYNLKKVKLRNPFWCLIYKF